MRPGGERVSIIDGISDMPWIPTGERSEIIDAHRDGTRFVVRADEKLIEFLELTWPIRG